MFEKKMRLVETKTRKTQPKLSINREKKDNNK